MRPASARTRVASTSLVVAMFGAVLVFLLAQSPAVAAVVATQVNRTSGAWNYDDDETATHAIVDVVVKGHVLTGGRDRLESLKYGYYPNARENGRLSCHGVRAIVINPSPVAGYNAPPTRLPCKAAGVTVTRDFADRVYAAGAGDRCFDATGYADKAYLPDPHFKLRQVCVR